MRKQRLTPLPAILLCVSTAFAHSGDALLDDLRAAAGPEARLAVLRAHSHAELEAAFTAVERRASEKFAANDCQSAAAEYTTAGTLAEALGLGGRLPLFSRRIGICLARLGKHDAALAAYQKGVAEAEKAGDRELLAENLH